MDPPKGPVSKKKPLEEEAESLGEEADPSHHDAQLERGIGGHGMENRKRLLEWPRKVIQSHTFSNQDSWFAAPQLSWSLCLAWTPRPPKSWPSQDWPGFGLRWCIPPLLLWRWIGNIQGKILSRPDLSPPVLLPSKDISRSLGQKARGYSYSGEPGIPGRCWSGTLSLHTQLVNWSMPSSPQLKTLMLEFIHYCFGSWQIWKPLNFEGLSLKSWEFLYIAQNSHTFSQFSACLLCPSPFHSLLLITFL